MEEIMYDLNETEKRMTCKDLKIEYKPGMRDDVLKYLEQILLTQRRTK